MDEPLEELQSQEFDLVPEDAQIRIGQVLSGRYRIDAVLSEGGLGVVYRGEHVHMRKQLAIKVLHPSTKEHPHLVARFEREAIAGAHIHHPNVAAATDFGQLEDGTFFLVMELVPGEPLSEILRAGRLPQRRAARIARQIAAGLAAAHAVGIAHRDLKPANVMVVEQPDDLVKIIDFGFARIDFNRLSLPDSGTPGKPNPPSLTTGTMIFGTPAYMAPETVGGMGAVDYRSDLYSLGVMTFEMITGERPFEEREVVRLLRRKNDEKAPSMASFLGEGAVSPALEAIVARLLERVPDDRFPSAHEAEQALAAILDDLPEDPRAPARDTSSVEIELGPTREITLPGDDATPSDRVAGDASGARPIVARRKLLILAAGGAVSIGLAAALWTTRGQVPTARPAAAPTALSPASSPVSAASSSSGAAPGAAPSATPDTPPQPAGAPRSDRSGELRADVWKAFAQKRWKPGAEALLALIEEDASALDRPDMVQAASSIAIGAANVDAPLAVRLIDALGGADTSGTVDVLYQIVRTAGASRRPGKHALGWLRRREVLDRATPAARVAIELRLADCAQKRPLFDRAAEQGDDRALAELQALYAMRCGTRKPGPCCFKRDAALSEALSTLSSRLSKK